MVTSSLPLGDIDVAILVGGLGTRLRSVVTDIPKPMAPVLGRPFLFYQLDMLALRGARSVTLCCGYKADQVRESVGNEWLGMPVRYSIEESALGTGGAIRHALPLLESDRILVLNGDSWLEPDWNALAHVAQGNAEIALALAHVEDAGRFGAVEMNSIGSVTAFREKHSDNKPGLINGGVYLIPKSILAALPTGNSSLERDLFPTLVCENQMKGTVVDSGFLDIGIPESYAEAGQFFTNLEIAPHEMFPECPDFDEALPKLGTCVVIVDQDGRVALELRSDCGWWGLPGGRLSAGESLEECAVREALEETGLQIAITGFLGVFSNPRRRTVRYPDNGDLRQLVDVAVAAKSIGGTLAASSESLEVRWFAPNDIPLNMVPPGVEVLRHFFRNEGQSVLR